MTFTCFGVVGVEWWFYDLLLIKLNLKQASIVIYQWDIILYVTQVVFESLVDENCIPSVGLGIPDFGLEYVIIVIHIW